MSLPLTQELSVDRLSDDIVRCILDFVVFRDSPFYIDDPHPGLDRNTSPISRFVKLRTRSVSLESSTGMKDPNFTGYTGGTPLHHRTLQAAHRKDWIIINSICRRFRKFGKLSFFMVKTFAMRSELPIRLQANKPDAINGMMLHDQALALSKIRDIVIVNQLHASPTSFLDLPRKLAMFPCLRRCTLLFGFLSLAGINPYGVLKDSDDVEWITAAFVLGGPVPLDMKELMAEIGTSPSLILEEAMGPGTNWQEHRLKMKTDIYPILRFKGKLARARVERERLAAT
ncbi:hypothetical protein EJ08DRAFT_388737 [Tothia fuscella]|uniref:Uncharacterized protein n=1 Tax=Tothia fuscella TaxID=1048955 RepID=A0A9P4P1S6_9PEZI|nr:hypothetical protein EJ08DRAFT_388737 [Tothia fuscella]